MLKGDCDADYPQASRLRVTLKANHGKLHHAVQQWFEQDVPTMATARSASVRRSGHHRIETRRYWSVPITAWVRYPSCVSGEDCKAGDCGARATVVEPDNH